MDQMFLRRTKGRIQKADFLQEDKEHLVKFDRFSLHMEMHLSCRCVTTCRKLASVRAAVVVDNNCDSVVSTLLTKPKLRKILCSPASKDILGILEGYVAESVNPTEVLPQSAWLSGKCSRNLQLTTMTILRLLLTKKVEHLWQNRIAQRFTTTSGNTRKHFLPTQTKQPSAVRWRSRNSVRVLRVSQ